MEDISQYFDVEGKFLVTQHNLNQRPSFIPTDGCLFSANTCYCQATESNNE